MANEPILMSAALAISMIGLMFVRVRISPVVDWLGSDDPSRLPQLSVIAAHGGVPPSRWATTPGSSTSRSTAPYHRTCRYGAVVRV